MEKINSLIGNPGVSTKQIHTRRIQKKTNTKENFEDIRRSRIEELKKKINNDDYLNEAINKLANSLTAGLMK